MKFKRGDHVLLDLGKKKVEVIVKTASDQARAGQPPDPRYVVWFHGARYIVPECLLEEVKAK